MRQDGVTLIELLIVMGIVGILTSIAAPRFGDTRDRAYVATMQSDLSRLLRAQEAHASSGDRAYAGSLAELDGEFSPSEGVTITLSGASQTGWTGEAEHVSSTRVCSYSTDTNEIVCGEAEPDEKDDGK